MTECDRIGGDLKSYTDNELPFLRQAGVRRHLAHCAACREELQQMTQISESLRAEDAQQNKSGVDPALRDRIMSIPTYAPLTIAPVRRKWRPAQVTALAIASTIVMLGGFRFWTLETHGNAYYAEMAPAPSVATVVPAEVPLAKTLHRPAFAQLPADSASAEADRRVHKEASISVAVADPEAKSDDVEAMVKAVGGYIADNDLETGADGLKTATMTIKFPVEDFETILHQIAQLGSVTARSVTAQDITDQVSDADQKEQVLGDEANRAETRIASLGSRAKWDDDETARDLRVQLAQARARLILLKKMGELSTISVTLTQTPPAPQPAAGFVSDMGDTGRSALASLIDAVATLLTGVI